MLQKQSISTLPIWVVVSSLLFPLYTFTADAQQITGVPGSPSATVTIDGKQLPPPPLPFGGVIKDKASESTPWWPPRVVPPKGAPNVLLIMTDDQGFGAPSTFGGVIPTPTMDRIANEGLRYTNFHSTSLCSPTRAAIITGRSHHSVGFDVLDLTEPEIKLLAEMAKKVTCADDLDAVADVISRLRLDGNVMDMSTFEALVLRGEIAAPPTR
jgi:hypothetical protein